MRYFSRGWFNGEYSEADYEHVAVDYQRRLDEVRPRFTAPILELADLNLLDALIEAVDWNPQTKRLLMSYVAGDLQVGYFSVGLTYIGSLLGANRVETLLSVAEDSRVEVLGDEVDVTENGTYVHRLIFWPTHELTIEFEDLEISKEDRPDRQVHSMKS